MKRNRYIGFVMAVLLMIGGAVESAWATKVTYHILTLPINSSRYNYQMVSEVTGYRLEALRVVVDQSSVELPNQFKSPLATNYRYYPTSAIVTGNSSRALQLFANNAKTKGYIYKVKHVDTEDSEVPPVTEGTAIEGDNAEYYVIYDYNDANTIAQLDGSVQYNIGIKGKGFLSYNRGRNNRPAVMPKGKVEAEMLTSEDFVKIENPGSGIGTYWDDAANNKNKKSEVESQFHFIFRFEGKDPYNIIIRNCYNRNITYIEKNDDGDKKFVYKWYKEGQLFSVGTANSYIASDIHKRYQKEYNSAIPNPTDLTEGTDYVNRNGQFHGQTSGAIWGSYALLNNNDNNGYVFMGTRTVDGNGAMPTPGSDGKYNYLKFDYNNLTINKLTPKEATNSYSTEGIYPIKTIRFHVKTPFGHTLTASFNQSDYVLQSAYIDAQDIPESLHRKYCVFTGFYSDADHTHAIVKYSERTTDDIYVDYEVSSAIPFQAIAPDASYTTATWYELTDEGSTQESGRKIKYDTSAGTYKNNGGNGEYVKESEFAFVGDPYELRVVYRNATSGATPYYVGAAGTPPTTGTALTINTSAGEGYLWEIPNDATSGSFLLRKYNGTGYWSWNAGQLSANVAYHDDPTIDVDKDAKTITITVSGLTGGKYFGITTGGTDASQIESITPAVGSVYDETANTVTVTVKLKENTGSAKVITVTIQEYDNDGGSTPSESPADPSVITITQGTTSTFEGNIVTYSTTERTRVKVLDLPKCDFTYKIVDKSGRIAVQATASQTIFSPLSLASIPSIIFSPFLADETVTFYKDEYVDNSGRATLTQSITETPEANDDIFVTYTTGRLSAKPIKLSEDQEFYVKLNDHYLYCEKVGEDVVVKTSSERVANDAYKWKLRNQDPYAMLIDNLGAREDLDVADDATERVTVYNDAGESVQEDGVTPATLDPENRPLRQVGAWVTLASIENAGALTFTTNRGLAQRFVAKRSNQGGIYEVMVATGTTVDASTTYYNIGCPGANTVKIYSNDVANGGYVHGSDVLRFVLESETKYTYHLIDKSNTILLEVGSESPDLMFPAEYQSPLVGTYYYYARNNINIVGNVYTVINPAAKLGSLSDLEVVYSIDAVASDAVKWGAKVAPFKQTAEDEPEMLSKIRLLEATGEYIFKVGESTYKKVTVTRGYRGRDIYVTYDKNDLVTFNSNTSPYLLKFLNPLVSGYRLENGNDGLTSEEIQAVYPYCNGDGNLNVYGTEMNREQMEGGSSTRPRWVWFFESDNNDPYHVKIHSKSTISFKSINHPTYLQTYAVHFNQDANAQKQHIVTGGVLPGISSIPPSEYMVLGTEGNYRLMTTDRVPADLNGDGTIDDSENQRQVVNAFEQYWKTYNMIKLDVLHIDKSTNAYDTDESTWVVPEAQRATLKATLASYKHTATDDGDLATKVNALTATGVYFFKVGDSYKKVTVTSLATADPAANAVYTAEDCNASDWEGLNYVDGWFWHSYDAFANATRWNGFNDKASGEEKKVVEKLEHWFQTIDMGNGAFDIVSADIPPVLVLLDRHGWEIMRKPLPKASTYPYGEELDALRIYDSPMVKEYKFYSNATKASGCHKYTLRLNDKGEERDQIKVDGEQFTSTSLAALPPRAASGVISSGAFNDQYVTYTVKDEYEESYRYHLNEETYAETESKASKYVVLCDGRYARNRITEEEKYHGSYFSKPIYEGSDPTGGNIYDMILSPTTKTVGNVKVDANSDGFVDDVCLWYVTPNLNIDEEMGIKWGTATTGAEPLTKNATKLAYKDKTGFDPYNIQLQNVNNQNFFTTHITSSKLVNGSMVGDYSGTGGSFYVTPEAEFTDYEPTVDKGSEGYDHTNLQISNQTFMAVQDAKGNMQLMPRFDHTKRINFAKYDPYIMTLADPVDHDKVATIADNESMGVQTMFFVRPQANIYHIIDNDGYEALRYRAGGEWNPIIPDTVKSPLAKDFRFYLTASYDALTGKYAIDENSEIKESIIGALADEQLYTSNIDIYVRYSYDEDNDEEWVLKGRWFTAQLANKDMQSSATRIVTTEGVTQGTGVSLFADAATPTKPDPVDEDDKVWQWKFLASPMDPSSPFYVAPDPYSVKIYNRYANYSNDPSVAPNPMSIPIKVPNASNGANRFALLSHYNGGYVFAVAKTYGANPQYLYINGADMTAPSTTPATTQTEGNAIRKDANNDSDYATKKLALSDGVYYFRIHGEAGGSIPLDHRVYRFKKVTVTDSGTSRTDEECTRTDWENARTEGIKVVLNNDVKHNYEYNVITNGGSDYVVNHPGVLAISANQNEVEASTYDFQPHLPEEAQTMLLNMEDYLYYGSVSLSDGKYTVYTTTKLISLEGLYDDRVYVRYNKYDVNTTPYKAPNIRNALNTGDVARAATSKDASINIKGELPYNIIWYNDNMMATTTAEGTTTITDGGSHRLTGSKDSVWYFTGGDPYALEIKHKASDKYAVGTANLAATATKTFMLLKKEDYDYGILQETGGTAKLTGYGNELTADASTDPTKFIIFGLSVHDLIYHLVIAKSCPDKSNPQAGEYVDIPYRATESGDLTTKTIYGTTQRDLTNNNYQLGEALSWANTSHTYCHDAGKVTVGDSLVVPSVFMRPNCVYFYYVDGIYNDAARTNVATELNNKYKGLELTRLPKDDDLVGKSVVVNVAYAFHTGLETNAGEGFVTNVADNYWYTFQTTEPTPYLAEYTKAWGLQAMEGRATRYTNDYLWSPLGDVYGFKMYNRYMYKNIGNTTNVMTKANINEAGLLEMSTPTDNAIFELLDVPNTPGAFRVHPVANYTGTQFYIYRDAADGNKVKLSTNYTGWTFGLGTDLLEPYIDRKGYVGGLTTDAYTTNKTVLDKVKDGTADQADIRAVQSIVYNDANIVQYSPGYYRLHSMPGIPGMATVRYASGYLHDTEKTAGYGSAGIPMHFYSRKGVATTFAGTDGLASGFTVSNATRGEIPIDSTEVDPSTIFHFAGAAAVSGYPSSTISTQGLYVVANANGDAKNGTTDSKLQRAAMAASGGISFTIMDIGGAVLLIHDGADAEVRRYFNYDQEANIYDLKFFHNANTEEARWCMQPVQKTAAAGYGEMPLVITTNNGGDGYYYATFYAPFDVLLPADADSKTYYAYYCDKWNDNNLHPKKVPAVTGTQSYAAGKYVPAGTPVIIRVNDESGHVTLTLPSTNPSASPVAGNIFLGQYLEQLLTADAAHDVYTLGLPFTSEVTGFNRETGEVTAPLPEQATSGLGFYINATPNKESAQLQSLWQRNNRYVLHNKIYYRATGGGGGAPDQIRDPQFVPVLFGDDDEQPTQPDDNQQPTVGDGNVYDLLGRKVATEAEVRDGTWHLRLTPGIYIVGGKKVCVGIY